MPLMPLMLLLLMVVMMTGWWFGTLYNIIFSHSIANVIIPIDFHIFRGAEATNQMMLMMLMMMLVFSVYFLWGLQGHGNGGRHGGSCFRLLGLSLGLTNPARRGGTIAPAKNGICIYLSHKTVISSTSSNFVLLYTNFYISYIILLIKQRDFTRLFLVMSPSDIL